MWQRFVLVLCGKEALGPLEYALIIAIAMTVMVSAVAALG